MTLDPTVIAQAAEVRQAEADFWAAKLAPPPAPGAALFSPDSIWNQPRHDAQLIDLRSSDLAAYIHTGVMGASGPRSAQAKPYVVTADTPRVPVTLIGYAAGWTPEASPPLEHLAGLATVFAQGVPIPEGFTATTDGDHTAAIMCPETGEYWDLYWIQQVPADQPNAGSWVAVGGGAIKDYRTWHGGGYDELAYPPYSTPAWGTRASGFPLLAGVMMYDELLNERVPHALAMSLPYPRLGWVAQPARRTDATANNGDQYAESYGYHYRLNMAESEIRGLGFTPLTTTALVAMAEFGFIPVDRGAAPLYGLYMDDGADHAVRHGGLSGWSQSIDGKPPIARATEDPNSAIISYSGSHFQNMWAPSADKLEVLRRYLVWPARDADGAY